MGMGSATFLWGGFPFWGVFLVILGIWWLGAAADFWTFSWAYAGPLALIAAGGGMIVAWAGKRK